jgi:hypothetical protein
MFSTPEHLDRCPICRDLIEKDHLAALGVEARRLAESFALYGQSSEPTGMALVHPDATLPVHADRSDFDLVG